MVMAVLIFIITALGFLDVSLKPFTQRPLITLFRNYRGMCAFFFTALLHLLLISVLLNFAQQFQIFVTQFGTIQ